MGLKLVTEIHKTTGREFGEMGPINWSKLKKLTGKITKLIGLKLVKEIGKKK